MKSGIYKITNRINEKIYIGSSKNLQSRKNEHFRQLLNKTHHCISLQRAYNKYGKKSFKFEIVEECFESVLIEREQYHIDTLKPEYNICKVAGRTIGFKHSKQSKKEMSKRRKGKSFHSKFQIKRIQEVHTNKVVSVDTRKKRARSVLQIDINGNLITEFYSLSEATRQTGIYNIANVVRGNQSKAGGYFWKYKHPTELDQKLLQNKIIRKQRNIKNGRIKAGLKTRKAVVQCDLLTNEIIQEFDSIKEAEILLTGTIKGNISATISGKQKTAYGYKWKYKTKDV